MTLKGSSEKTVREIKRRTRRKYSAEEKIRIILDGLRGEDSIAEICRRKGIHQNMYYKWSRAFLEAGKKRLMGDTMREASTDEVKEIRQENLHLKQLVADLALKHSVLKKKISWVELRLGRMMRYTQAEKYEIIRAVEESDLPAKRTLAELSVPTSTFYDWYKRFFQDGYDGLKDRSKGPQRFWNKIPDEIKKDVVDIALEHTDKSPRELAWHISDNERYYISETSVYRILKAHDLITSPNYIVISAADKFRHPTKAINELWQTDFTYLKVVGWGWYYLSTVLDDYSRYILAWLLFTSMSAFDVQETLDVALAKTNLERVRVRHRPRLLSDNGPCYLSKELKAYLKDNQMDHTRGAPYHPQTQGKIERYHRSMKSVIKLEHYYMPGELRLAIGQFVDHYNNHRYHESLDNCTPADVYSGRYKQVLTERQKIKQQTLKMRYAQNMDIKSINQVNYPLL